MDDGTPGTVATAEPAASPAAPGSEQKAEPAASPAADSGGAPSAPSPESPNIRQLREQYETLKGQHEPYKKLGEYDRVSQYVEHMTKVSTEANELGSALGYSEADIEESLQKDPVGTLAFLRNKHAEMERTGDQPDPRKLIQTELDKRLKPFEEREKARQEKENELLTTQANVRFRSEFDRLHKEAFPEGMPESVTEALFQVAQAAMDDDEDAVMRMKYESKTSDIAAKYNGAKEMFLKLISDWNAYEQKRVSGTPMAPKAAKAGGKKYTLEDMAAGDFPPSMAKYG